MIAADLTPALSGPLLQLEQQIIQNHQAIEHWFRAQWHELETPFYASVDLRNSGFKLAPVDTNLFPGGFNNLKDDFLPLCVQASMVAIQKLCPDAKGVLLVPENHTRNQFYLQNVARLRSILRMAGVRVRIGTLIPEITAPTALDLPDGGRLTLEPIVRRGNRLGVEGFDPCVVLLNNDLSAGIPALLQNIEQQVIPPTFAGWSTRRKSRHFAAYSRVAEEFARLIGIDPWLLDPYFGTCGEVNFQERTGEECLAQHVSEILERVRAKYREYGIDREAFAIVKADAGTYGMGIMTVKSPDDVRDLNRKQRNKMAVVKEGLAVSDVMVQEGVYTFETVNEAVAEPVIYMIDQFVVGGFYRVHTGRGQDENLNAPGMHFEPMPFDGTCLLPELETPSECPPNRFYAYGVVARLALVAAAVELEEMAAQAEAGEQPLRKLA
ncbi:MAG: glutamate--cysteine ligase [Burkholderiales bacterium]|nr:glutamate--cysteine ligase [Burkholderiales bacterium]